MNISIRSVSGLDYFDVSIEDGNARIDLGLLDKHERTEMAINLVEAAWKLLPTPCDRLTAEVEVLAGQCEVAVVPASHPTADELADALRELFSTTAIWADVDFSRADRARERAEQLLERIGK